MYAIIRSGSKQYRVSPGDEITVEKIDREAGEEIEFEEVLLLNDGKGVVVDPEVLRRAKVRAEVIAQGRSEKIVVFKYRPKKGYRRKKGHRQQLTRVRIKDIII